MTSTQSREEAVFKSHQDNLRSKLTEIDNLLQHFVEGNVITETNLTKMRSLKNKAKLTRLLSQISDQLKDGKVKGFYTMLNIMEKYGDETTKGLSSAVMSNLKVECDDDKKAAVRKTQVS